MRCGKCGSDNREGRKFCANCGTALSRQCPHCGAPNEAGEKFCGDCGTALAPDAAPVTTPAVKAPSAAPAIRVTPEEPDASGSADGERKTVTALFADIKGSTELMEDLDPEEARAIIDPALKLMIEAVRRYDGYVVQSTGDGIFALFGAPMAHEDHPQRALYAALRMQEDLGRHSDRVRAEGGLPIQARIGVNTGEVVVRSITTGEGQTEYTPIGHTTNLAARMQTLAPIGSIAATDAARKLCEGYFIFRGLGPTKVKGLTEPVNVYEVTGLGPLRTRLQRSAGRGLTKFVGRDLEMQELKDAADQAKAGHGQIVAVMAEAGVGKSRLFFEFKAISQSSWMVLETFSVLHGKASAYLPLIDLLRNYFDISAGDDERKRREKVAGRVAVLDRSLEEALPYLFSLVGIVEGDDPLAQMDGQIKKRRTLEAIKRILLRESLNQPLMVIFEDLHWIDEATQEFLTLLADSLGTAKILLLINYRPEYSHQWSNKTYYTQLRLDPIGQANAEEMLSALLGGDGKDLIPLKRMIIERTEGIPFFMEEIVQSLFDDGVLQRDGTVKLAKSMNAVKVPATVQGVLAARIDRLSPEEKKLLQTLGVLGREFSFGMVQRVTLKFDDDLNRMLTDLQLAEFIYEQPAVGDTEYIFKHALTQEVAYNSMLVDRRKQLHERAGASLESIFAGQLEDHLDELAHHYSRSANLEKAVEYLGRAGQQALQRSVYGDAINRLTAAIDLLQKQPEDAGRMQHELQLQLSIGPAFVAIKGGWGGQEVERAYSRARELSMRLGDPPQVFPALLGLWAVHALREELPQAFEIAEQLRQRAQVTDDRALLMYAQYPLGFTSFWMGEFLRAREHFEAAIAGYDPQLHRQLAFLYGFDVGVHSLSYLALTLSALSYPDQALERANQAFAVAQMTSNPVSLVLAAGAIGTVRQYRQEASAVQENAEIVIELSTRHGLTEVLPLVIAQRGWVLAQQGRHEEGIAEIQEVVAGLRESGAWLVLTYILNLLVDACMRMESLDPGLRALTEATAGVKRLEGRSFEAETLRFKGELLLRQNDSNSAEAQACFERAIAVARKQSAKTLELRATMSLARLLDKQGKRDKARAMLAEIYGWFTEGFATADLKDAKQLLDELTE